MDAPRIVTHALRWRNTPGKRSRNLGLIVHHTAGNWDTETVEGIHAYHRDSKGWAGFGYNYLVDKAGVIHLGRPDGAEGAHCAGFNDTHIGVAVSGNFERDKPTGAQLEAVAHLWAWLSERYDWDLDPDTLTGHRDHQVGNECPGDRLYARLGSIVQRGRHIARGGILEWQGHTLTYGMDAEGDTAIVGVRELAEALGLSVDVTGWPRVVVS